MAVGVGATQVAKRGCLDGARLPASTGWLDHVQATVSADELVLRSQKGFGPEIFQRLQATWDVSHSESAWVSFTLTDGHRFGPLPLSLDASLVPEPNNFVPGLLGLLLLLSCRQRAGLSQ